MRTGLLKIELKGKRLVDLFGCKSTNINPSALITEAPFRMRRREVELKLRLGEAPREIDKPLVQNVVKAAKWLDMIIESKTFSDIADCEGVSKRRVQDVVDLALLALDILEKIAVGEQPCGLTTDYLIKTG